MTKNEAKSKSLRNTPYNHKEIELKWRSKWIEKGIYQPNLATAKKPFYNLMMFPYPSAEGLHVGSVYTFSGVDVYGRFQRMRGYDVFQPIGLDGFGIHSENHAIKTGTHPIAHAERTEKNFYRQLQEIGNGFAWDNKLETYDPNYYKWTQWLFTELFKAGLAYKKKAPVNFCPSCKTVLADEQVIDGACERCSSIVEKRELDQWFFRITDYVDRLLTNIKDLNWSDKVRIAQTNWIGKSEGALVEFGMNNKDIKINVFTTALDTIFGVTFIVIAPEHPELATILADVHEDKIKREVQSYIKQSAEKSEIERSEDDKEKTGVFSGAYVINPFTNEQIPVWIADYVLANYGTGAVMGVPAHDARDYAFAKKFNLPIKPVIQPNKDAQGASINEDGFWNYSSEIKTKFQEKSELINSGQFTGLSSNKAKKEMEAYMQVKGFGKPEATYHLRDWLISRQRYWGPPIPMIYCESCAEKKPKIVLIHGLSGSSEENWFPWFKGELERKGYEVLIPDLPHPDNPTLREWIEKLNDLGITKDDKLFIIGHSLGGPTACQFIIQGNFNVEKLILVAPTGKEQDEQNWKHLSKEGVEVIKTFNAANGSLNKLNDLVKKRILYLSDNDPYIPMAVSETYKAIAPKIVQFKNKGHFNTAAGLTIFPDILNEFPVLEDLSLGWYPVPVDHLPVKLPEIEDFKPLGTGNAPLANHPEFYEVNCPQCKSKATRETDVSDTFLDSAWYFFRYVSAHDDKQAFDLEIVKKWLPVTMYIGGAEHAVLHLLYARFITMVLHDLGHITFEEPFARFYAHGLVIKDGAKMSKSKGNVINPDEYITKYGADTLRTYLRFLGPFDQTGDFRDSGIEGMNKFIKRVWALLSVRSAISNNKDISAKKNMHQTIKGVTEDMEGLRFNTAIAKLMTWYNLLVKQDSVSLEEQEVFLQLLAPFAPYLTEELWEQFGHSVSIHNSEWPVYDEAFITKDSVTIAVQVNGKLRATLEVSPDQAKEQGSIEKQARVDAKVTKFLEEGTIRKVIYVPNKILNFVVS